MPVNVQYLDDGKGVLFEHVGVTLGEDLVASICGVIADERYPQNEYWIADRTKCTKFLVESAHVREIVRHLENSLHKNPGLRIAMISESDLVFGMSRMFQSLLSSSHEVSLFKTVEEAKGWLFN